MEFTRRKKRRPVYLIVAALLLVAAIAVGIWLITGGGSKDKTPRGTYVMAVQEEVLYE